MNNNLKIFKQLELFNDINKDDYKVSEYINVDDVTPLRDYNVVELFAGAGGMSLGFEKAGLKNVGNFEIDKDACETLKTNRPDWNVVQGDLNIIAEEGIRKYLKSDSEIDIVSGGIPCQAFSYAGRGKGIADTRGTLFHPMSIIINDLKPKIFILENVKGLTTHDKGKTLETMIDVFEDINYKVQWNVLNAWDYNTAQKRERMFMIGINKDFLQNESKPYKYPLKQEYKPVLKDVLKDVPASPGRQYSEKKFNVMKLVPPGGCWVDLPEDIAKEYMKKSYYLGGGKRGMARRISWDEPSLTLTTSPDMKQTERCHPDETRPFTVREYARIQSFPDSWTFSGSMTSQYRQIGNAVPVNLAKYVALSVIDYLNQYEV